jgi:hypothetical protein
MQNFYFAVIPAQAGIQWLQELRDPCLRRDDGEEAFFDTLLWGEGTPHRLSFLRRQESLGTRCFDT